MEVELAATGTTPTGTGTLVSTNPYTVAGLTQGTCYDFMLKQMYFWNKQSMGRSLLTLYCFFRRDLWA
jgi:hypothetical protein